MTQAVNQMTSTPNAKTAPVVVDNATIYETNTSVALPGDTTQLYYNFVGEVLLEGVVIDEGGELQRVIAGPHTILPGPNGEWVFGQRLTTGAYVIALVKNVSPDSKALKAAFVAKVTMPSPGVNPAPGSLTSPHASSGMPGGHGASTAPQAPTNSPTVTPGSNEVAVLLSYGEAKRVLEVVNGGSPISDAERASIARSFQHGFQRSGM